ncbi:MAG: aconitate hydratase AcnA [Pelolinea sp.]|nr:aconitate hydratase AcnA [Pelolinea sp.]
MVKLFGDIKDSFQANGKTYSFFSLPRLAQNLSVDLSRLPYSLRVLLEGCLRQQDKSGFPPEAVDALVHWKPDASGERPAVPFMPARVLMQDFTGLPVLNDLTALRAALKRQGKDPLVVNPSIPCDLVIDHSLTVEAYGCADAQRLNEEREFDLNLERYAFLKWSQIAYKNLRVLPPGLGICHQVNLEYLSQVAFIKDVGDQSVIYPDSVLGTDSHTTMVNGLGVLGWGVGGIEALAAMLGYPSEFSIPNVVGVEITGSLLEGVSPTDLTLTLTSRLRALGVVNKFIEVFGPSCAALPVETRAMIANMSPESGATATYFPVDGQTLNYLRRTGRLESHINLVETYYRAQGLYREDGGPHPKYSQILQINLGEIQPVMAGPKRPQDIFPLSGAKQTFKNALAAPIGNTGYGLNDDEINKKVKVAINGQEMELSHGAVLIAAITSCTNTSDPSVMITAGLLARNAAAKGLRTKPWVKTSFAPGSRAVRAYLSSAGLLEGLEALGFQIVGYGCTTCIGNSGPIDATISRAIRENGLVGAAVLSGNRNFEGRIHPDARASFLAAPPLVVAYALTGSVDFDFEKTPLGIDASGNPVYLKNIYPTHDEVVKVAREYVKSDIYYKNYDSLYEGNQRWNDLDVPKGDIFPWDSGSSLIREPSFLLGATSNQTSSIEIQGARALAVLGDSITTDHISPAGRIAPELIAGQYLQSLGVKPADFISFGARRGNHEVMARGTFSNPRLRNLLTPDVEGGFTRHLPDGEVMTIFNASMRYQKEGAPLIILAGKLYGSGSSRDWAAKGTYLLGVRAVIAESFERIHRTNLACMSVLPLQFASGENAQALGLNGDECFTIFGVAGMNTRKTQLTVAADSPDGKRIEFQVTARIDTPLEMIYFKASGLMRKVLIDLNT